MIKKWLNENSAFFAWTLSAIVTVLAVMIWLEELDGEISKLSAYDVFPLLGIIAFSLMWAHYIVYALRVYSGFKKESVSQYFSVTSSIVLGAILLHPGLLIMQLYLDGAGLPPESYKSYVASSSLGFVYLGVISLIIFLLFELHEKFGNRSWWKFVNLANVIAMLLIYWHANELGQRVDEDWYSFVWSFYGISLVATYIYLGVKKKLI